MTKPIPTGYKQTKVGVIPDDWEVVKVGEVCDSIVPGRNKPANFNGIIPWITTPDITSKHIYDTKSNLYITIEEAKKIGSKIVPKNSVIMSCVGELGLLSLTQKEIVINQQLHAFLPSSKIQTEFLYYTLSLQKSYMDSVATKTSVPYMNKNNCNSIPIPLPPIKEQEKIAEILSTWDDAIIKQEQLIEQKQVFKRGIMQQIFSQKIRFKDDNDNDYPAWQIKKLGEALFFIRNNSFSRNQLNLNNGLAQNIHYGDIHTKFSNYIDVANSVIPYINADVDIEPIQNHEYCQDGDLIIADASEDYKDVGKSVEIKNIGTKKILSGLHTILARNKISFALGFKAYLMQSTKMRSQIEKIANGISVLGISKTNLANTLLDYPCLEEQTKIADFLTSVDDEIIKQTEILDQLKLQKQSLMQKLLTGQVRVSW